MTGAFRFGARGAASRAALSAFSRRRPSHFRGRFAFASQRNFRVASSISSKRCFSSSAFKSDEKVTEDEENCKDDDAVRLMNGNRLLGGFALEDDAEREIVAEFLDTWEVDDEVETDRLFKEMGLSVAELEEGAAVAIKRLHEIMEKREAWEGEPSQDIMACVHEGYLESFCSSTDFDLDDYEFPVKRLKLSLDKVEPTFRKIEVLPDLPDGGGWLSFIIGIFSVQIFGSSPFGEAPRLEPVVYLDVKFEGRASAICEGRDDDGNAKEVEIDFGDVSRRHLYCFSGTPLSVEAYNASYSYGGDSERGFELLEVEGAKEREFVLSGIDSFPAKRLLSSSDGGP